VEPLRREFVGEVSDCKANRMSYDLNVVQQLCREIGLPARIIDVHHLGVDLGEGAVLCFQNAESEADCLMQAERNSLEE
jgi:hypothetical protein